jgi:hypothetical protein
MFKKRLDPPSLAEFETMNKSSQWRWRTKHPELYPEPDYIRWGIVPTLEFYENSTKQYQYYLRKKHPGVFPEVRKWVKKSK